MYYQIEEVVEMIIYREHGWAVAEQFKSICDDRSQDNIAEQNLNALDYIVNTLNNVIKSNDIFDEESLWDIMDIRSDIKKFLDEVSHINKNDYQ